MKKNFAVMLLSAAGFIIFVAPNFGFGQTVQIPSTGSYNAATVGDVDVNSAANFAIKTRSKKQKAKIKLIAVKKAERQVVAGSNFRLCLQIETIEKNQKTAVPQIVEAIVLRDLKNKFSLTSWAIAACAEETVVPRSLN